MPLKSVFVLEHLTVKNAVYMLQFMTYGHNEVHYDFLWLSLYEVYVENYGLVSIASVMHQLAPSF